MMQTTLRKIRAAGPCGMRLEDGQRVGYLKLRHYLGKGYGDDKPIDIATILDSNGVEDALWCLRAVDGHAREMRLYAVWCARQVQHLMADQRSINALDVAVRHANGTATDDELAAARGDALAAALAAARDAAWDAALAAARDAAWDAARGDALAAARAAAWDAARGDARGDARDVQAKELRRVCDCISAGQDPYPAAGEVTP